MVRAMFPAAVLVLSPLDDKLFDAFLLLAFLLPPALLDFLLPPESPVGGSCTLSPLLWCPVLPLAAGDCSDLRPA